MNTDSIYGTKLWPSCYQERTGKINVLVFRLKVMNDAVSHGSSCSLKHLLVKLHHEFKAVPKLSLKNMVNFKT